MELGTVGQLLALVFFLILSSFAVYKFYSQEKEFNKKL